MRNYALSALFGLFCFLASDRAEAQHLWWDTQKLDDATCLYGEITVLATHPAIYYCGANWHPGEPAGGTAIASDLHVMIGEDLAEGKASSE